MFHNNFSNYPGKNLLKILLIEIEYNNHQMWYLKFILIRIEKKFIIANWKKKYKNTLNEIQKI